MGGTDVSEKPAKERISVTLTRPYLDALELLVKDGFYLSRGEIIMEALRKTLGSYGVEPFTTHERTEAPR